MIRRYRSHGTRLCDCGQEIDGRSARCRACYVTHAATRPLADRFWEKVARRGSDECWPWQAGLDRHGYGHFNSGNSKSAHRVAYTLTVGEPGPGRVVMHTCDNPPCCNPAHLRAGSQADNLADMTAKGRAGPHPRKIDAAAVVLVKARIATKEKYQSIADDFGVSRALIRAIAYGRRRAAE